MTHAENSLKTKNKLSNSLKKLMNQKPFSKITVSEIIRDCNVNRKTFYYHFEDIYALLKWMFEQEAINVVKEYNLPADYKKALSFVIDYIEQNAFILNCVYDSIGLEEMKRFFHHDVIDIIRTFIDGEERALGLRVSNEFKTFLCNLYTEGFTGILLQQIKYPEQYDKEQLIAYYSMILGTSLPAVLCAAPVKGPVSD